MAVPKSESSVGESRLQQIRDMQKRQAESRNQTAWRDNYDEGYRRYRLAYYEHVADIRVWRGQEPDRHLEDLIAEKREPTPTPPPNEVGRYPMLTQAQLDEMFANLAEEHERCRNKYAGDLYRQPAEVLP